jgi:hypothetical protein
LVAVSILGALPAAASAAELVVNTTEELPTDLVTCGPGGDEPCLSLANAILESNTSEGVRDTITFAGIPAGSVIEPSAELPLIDDAVTIDGFVTEGPATGRPEVEISGELATAFAGLDVQGPSGVRIEGLAIGGFTDGIRIEPAEGTMTGTEICGNYVGVKLNGAVSNPDNYGIEVFGADGEAPEETTIGNGSTCPGNVVGGSRESGIVDEGRGTTIAGNRIGIGPAPGDVELPNGTNPDGFAGGIVEGQAAEGAMIGGTGVSAANVIAFNGSNGVGGGVVVLGTSGQVSIRANSIFGNVGAGIEFPFGGGPPVPTITSVASPRPGVTLVKGTMEGVEPNETAELDFFANEMACGAGEVQGQTYLSTGTVSGGGDGPVEYSAELPVEVPAGETGITATATRAGGAPNHATSEFSACATYTPPPAPPAVAITTSPPASTTATDATFEFATSGGDVTGFECSLDGAAYAPCSSPRSLGGLAVGSHTFAVRAVGEGARTGPPTVYEWTVASPPQSNPPQQSGPPEQAVTPPGPTPTNGEKVVVEPEEGRVRIKLPGTNRYVPLTELKEIPVGAVIDATKGKVHLTSIDPDGTEQSADFFGGVFKVKQKEGAGLVVLELLDTQSCKVKKGGKGTAQASSVSARPTGGGTKGKLWGSGHGNFRTEGNDGSATVRGTIWLVEDRCDGTTFFKTRRGVVSVRDFVLHTTLPLPAGKTYVAGE